MLNDFVDVFGFRPGSLNPLLASKGFVGGVENDLVVLRIRAMEERCREAEKDAKEAKEAGDERGDIFWLGVLETMKADTHNAKNLARHFEFPVG